MKLFVCKRREMDWEGGLIIAALTKEKAVELFKEYEHDEGPPFDIRELSLENEIVLYDDECR